MAVMFLINGLMHFALIDDSASYTRIMMHDFYNYDKNIDILFLGSSHCYRSLIPEITDTIFNAATFNAGSSLQGLDASYALLREADRKNDLKEVYVELYYGVTAEDFAKRTDLTSTYLISDYMKAFSPNRLSLILSASSNDYYINGLILGRRNWEMLSEPSLIINNIKTKLSPAYTSYTFPSQNGDEYMYGGFIGSSHNFNGAFDTIINTDTAGYFNGSYLSSDCKKYIVKMINYCKKRDIALTFYTAPMSDASLIKLGNYDSYINEVRDFLSGYDAGYTDFNLTNTAYLDLKRTDYYDAEHLNTSGAKAFSRVFADYFTKGYPDDFFYNSYDKKLSALDDTILALQVTKSDDSSRESFNYWDIETISKREASVEYKVTFTDTDGNERLINDWDSYNIIELPGTDTGCINISVRYAGSKDVVYEARVAAPGD